MQTSYFRRQLLARICISMAPGIAFAAKPEGTGQGNNKKHSRREDDEQEPKVGAYFGERHRVAASEYYGQQSASGRCPPGLAKKHNGCMPPGQAKKWALGQPLPRDVVLYPVPREVVIRIGTPPPGYRYVRVANDILLIATGSKMVIDAIRDLMG